MTKDRPHRGGLDAAGLFMGYIGLQGKHNPKFVMWVEIRSLPFRLRALLPSSDLQQQPGVHRG
ncbi:hypothetical protein, partial [Mitsuokella jalaludinii]|uniref:hypothetical protein n=1 Tax=Mitsuokella jalaludinii TaxID=187979 RepID=UPI0030810D3B